MNRISLAGDWYATWGDGLHGRMEHFLDEMKDSGRYLHIQFPGSIQKGLEDVGIIDDPRVGINSLSARWVEEHYWILRKTFSMPEKAVSQHPQLCIDILDGVAKIALNGKIVGEHWSAHRPARIDLSCAIRAGENELVILLESGLFKVADLPGKEYTFTDDTLLNKRHHLRQAQYQFGWDWNPRLVYFGLHGDIAVRWGDQPILEQVLAVGKVADDLQSARIHLKPLFAVPNDIKRNIKLNASAIGCCSEQVWSGTNDITLSREQPEGEVVIDIYQPELWYPRGYGDPHLYHLTLTAEEDGNEICRWNGKIGLRKVELLQPPHPQSGRYFHIQINDQIIFWKGGNWVPPEMSAHEVAPERVKRLVELAVEQNMNALRIWGGGVWAGHVLLDLCDENGIMIWHDMLFACAKYPADRPEFYAEVGREAEWGIREFSRHPSLIVWSGNNELEWGHWSWGYQSQGRVGSDYVLFHHLFPKIISELDSSKLYWPSSPYSSPTEFPNDPTRGDQHPWNVSLGTDTVNFWAYRKYVDRFPNEGGVLGCAPVASLRKFLSPTELKMRSFAWEHHDNTANYWSAIPGIAYRMVENWFGLKMEALSVEEYALASGLVQAEGLKEYILNYRRRFPGTTSAIYWDYNDSWPTVTGWGTMDYYLNRKLSFHPVRRSFAEITVVLADDEDEIGIYAINQTGEAISCSIAFGHFSPGTSPIQEPEMKSTLPPQSAIRIACLEKDDSQIFYALLKDIDQNVIAQDRLLLRPFHAWNFTQPEILISKIETPLGKFARYESKDWVWNVILDASGEIPAADDVFDLLPGIPYLVPLADGTEPLPVQSSGNLLMLLKR